MGRREGGVGQGVRLSLLRHRSRPQASFLERVASRVLHGGHGGGVAPTEHLRDDLALVAPDSAVN